MNTREYSASIDQRLKGQSNCFRRSSCHLVAGLHQLVTRNHRYL